MNEDRKVRVFVYGTLQQGECNHRVIHASRCEGKARTAPRFTLYSLGSFPALVAGGGTPVAGEVYEVDSVTLANLDQLEGHPRFYRRQELELEDGSRAVAYLQRLEQVHGRSKIASGSWRDHQKGQQCGFG